MTNFQFARLKNRNYQLKNLKEQERLKMVIEYYTLMVMNLGRQQYLLKKLTVEL